MKQATFVRHLVRMSIWIRPVHVLNFDIWQILAILFVYRTSRNLLFVSYRNSLVHDSFTYTENIAD